MALGAMRREERFAAFSALIVDGEDVARPRRRLQHCDFFFQSLQPRELRRIVAIRDQRGTRWDMSDDLRLEIGKHAVDLAGVAAERLDEESIAYPAVPLRAILPRCVPQERIADRRVGDLEVAGDAEVTRGNAIEDHPERIEPSRSPWRRGQAGFHEIPELLDPGAEVDLELGRFGRRIA